MFWKIIVEKLFNVNISKNEDLEPPECCRTDSVRSVAKMWQTEMVQQAMFVRNITPFLSRTPRFPNACLWKGSKTVKKEPAPCNLKPCVYPDDCTKDIKRKCNSYTMKTYKLKSTDTDGLSCPSVSKSGRPCSSHTRKLNRQCSARVKMVDMECDACNDINDEITTYKINLEYLQDKFNCQKKEIEKLKRENSSLRIELHNVYKNSSWKSSFYTPTTCTSNNDTVAILPKPFECCGEEDICNRVKGIDSEMIITMKNCKNEVVIIITLNNC